MQVYADNAATTKISAHALQAMMPCFEKFFGNPSSLHTVGQEAKEMLALLEKCQPEQKNYIAGVIDGMNAERRLSADNRSA